MATISLKALVDKEKNKVVFVEADEHFLNVLFSFLTMPIGTIIKLIGKHPPTSSLGCMNNLYASVGDLDVKYFRTDFCRTILQRPQNVAGDKYKNLKIKIDDSYISWYYICPSTISSTCRRHKSVSYSAESLCDCGEIMRTRIALSEGKQDDFNSDAQTGAFVQALVRQLVTDDLLLRLTSTSNNDLLSGFDVTNYDALEEMTFNIGENEVLGLLKCSLISNTPLTEVLLKPKAIGPELRKDDALESKHTASQKKEQRTSKGSNKMSIKLVTSRSGRKVCYAEAGEDFVDLLFSFLTIPLGYILKEMSNVSSKGCINHLYESVRKIDDKCMKSIDIKNLLLGPKVAPCHSYPNHPLGLEEAKQQFYYHRYQGFLGVEEMLTTDAQIVLSGRKSKRVALSLKDPKSPSGKGKSTGGGYLRGPARFTVSDDLVIVPISPVCALSNLKKLNVPLHDIEEKDVNVGKEEALRLLIAAFSSDAALTDAFLH